MNRASLADLDSLLLLLIRPILNGEDLEEIKRFQEKDLDWEYILDRAKKDMVSPIIYCNLKKIGRDGYHIPYNIFEKFERDYYMNAARNILIYKEMERILQALQREEIKVIVFKGAALGEEVYNNIALRPMTDIDFLIKKDDLEMIDEKLSESGYYLAYHSQTGGERHYAKPGSGFMNLDIHWNTWQYKANGAWENAREIKIGEAAALTLAPEDLLISLASHSAVHHGKAGGIWLVDIAMVINHYKDEFNWRKFIDKVKNYGVEIPLYYTLYYAKRRLGGEIPLAVLKGLKPPRSKFLEAKLYEFILNNRPVANTSHLLYPWTFKGFSGKIRFLFRFIFPNPDFLRMRYKFSGTLRLPLYYFIRPFFLSIKLARVIFHLLF